MGLGKIKLASALKIFAIFAYLIYFSINNTSLIKYYEGIFSLKSDAELKSELLSNKCLLLLGGSNVRIGLSAEIASSKSCEALNLGVSGEGGGFQKYFNWLVPITLADKVIYSSAEIWRGAPLSNNGEEPAIEFPKTSLFSFIKAIFVSLKNPVTPQFNKFGDQIDYQCLNEFPSFNIKTNEFINSNHLVTQEIYKRISKLKQKTSSREIFVRVPPVYVKSKKQAELYASLMNERTEILKGRGVKIVGSTIVSTDGNLICDSFHPNAKGREEFTKEIVLP